MKPLWKKPGILDAVCLRVSKNPIGPVEEEEDSFLIGPGGDIIVILLPDFYEMQKIKILCENKSFFIILYDYLPDLNLSLGPKNWFVYFDYPFQPKD